MLTKERSQDLGRDVTDGVTALSSISGSRAILRDASVIQNAFTIDVEDYYHVSALASAIPRDTWSSRESRVAASTDRVLALLDERRIKGTFFVLGWVADHVPSLIKRIASLGHEVACHGYSHELIYRQTPEVFAEETRRSKRLLEDLVGMPVIGYRAASFSITPRSRWALDTLIEEGFAYDSSIFPVRHDRYGMPGAARAPGYVDAPSGRRIAEFPMSTAAVGPFRVPVSGGGYFRLLPYWFTRSGLRSINQQDGMPFTFYLHPWEIDSEQPRVKTGFVSRFRHYTNLSKCEARLRQLLGDFRFTTMRNVLRARGLLSS
ncbi:MAG TPA: XrtA system polysaccharide deacetylase [Steroidobacteraceae bacterium]|jgi:polysaccharide deacetylase family protein (PEP-CTERM system associated)|nr:XrtA system polysaccharide deacetylase [Steroidobacteraceae bacterium]